MKKSGYREPPKLRFTRRQFIIGGICLAGVGGLVHLLSDEKKISFQEAQKNPNLRSPYVAYWQRQFQHLDHISSIAYSTNEAPKDHAGMATNFVVGTIGNRIKQSITVFKVAFEDRSITNENDFLSVLVDHEIDSHARIFYEGSPEFQEDEFLIEGSKTEYNSNVAQDVFELYAYENQWKKRKERSISSELEKHTLIQFWKRYSDLIHPIRDTSIANKASLEKFRKRFFLNEFQHMHVSFNNISSPFILPNNKIMTFYGPIDLPAYLKK